MINKIRSFLKNLDEYWIYLNEPDDNPNIDKSKKEIVGLLNFLPFILGSLTLLEFIKPFDMNGFVFPIFVLIFMVLVFVNGRISNSHKRLIHQHQVKSSPQLHE